MELGIAGVPRDVAALEAMCARLGVAPVFLLAPGESLSASNLPLHILHIAARTPEAMLSVLRGRRLAGLWSASQIAQDAIAGAAIALGLPCLTYPEDSLAADAPLFGGSRLELSALEHLSDAERRQLPLPVWVRASRGNGDSSCVRLEHPDDLSLSLAKLKKRGVNGAVRLQPVLEGPVYRLMAFKTGRDLVAFDIVQEETTTSMYRVPLSISMPVTRNGTLYSEVSGEAQRLNRLLSDGWGYLELEFVGTPSGPVLTDVQCPAMLDPLLRALVIESQGVDLHLAVLQCALGRRPYLSPNREVGVAATWLLTRSGRVTGFRGIEEARGMPGITAVEISAREGDIVTHVVDIPSRERGGYIIAMGATAEAARARLALAREQVWINTSPVEA